MKIQISPKRIVADAVTVWNEPGPEIDVTMDVANLTFKPGSVDALYSFHVLDHLFPHESKKALDNWLKCLKPEGQIFVVVDDFEYVCRSFVGGDISISEVNASFTHPAYFDRYNLADMFRECGILDGDLRIWYADVPDLFPKKHYELIMNATKK